MDLSEDGPPPEYLGHSIQIDVFQEMPVGTPEDHGVHIPQVGQDGHSPADSPCRFQEEVSADLIATVGPLAERLEGLIQEGEVSRIVEGPRVLHVGRSGEEALLLSLFDQGAWIAGDGYAPPLSAPAGRARGVDDDVSHLSHVACSALVDLALPDRSESDAQAHVHE